MSSQPSSPSKETNGKPAAEETDGKPHAKKPPPPSASDKPNGDKDGAAEAAPEGNKEKPKEPPKVKLLASKTLLLRRALECPAGGTGEDRPTPGVPVAASAGGATAATGATANVATTTATFPVQNMPPIQMPLPNIPHTADFSLQFAAFQQQQQQQFFAAQAYQRKLAMEMHEKAMKEAAAEKKRQELAAKRAASMRKRGRPKKTATGDAVGDDATSPKKPKVKPAPAEPGAPKAVPELLWEGTPPETIEGGWPEGWSKQTFMRMGGSSAGTKDSYWVTPIKNYKLRSMTEVKAFLAALEENGGDEIAARKVTKKPHKKKQKLDGEDTVSVEAEVVQGESASDTVAEPAPDTADL
jgi:Methyl-CpG binding domain